MKDKSKMQVAGGKAFGNSGRRIAAIALGVGLLLSVLYFGGSAFAQNASEPDTDNMTSEELLEFLIAKNEEAWEKINNVSYEFRWSVEDNFDKNKHIFHQGKGIGIRKKDNSYLTYTLNVNRNGIEGKVSGKSVLNDQYVASWWSKEPDKIEQHMHQSIAKMGNAGKANYEIGCPSIVDEALSICFGGYSVSPRIPIRPLKVQIQAYPDVFRWEAEKGADAKYRINIYEPAYMKNPTLPKRILTIDSKLGYLITSLAVNHPSGSPNWRISVECGEIVKGIWFPVEFNKTVYSEQGNILYAGTINYLNVKINKDVDQKQFELDALNLPESIILYKLTVDGDIFSYIKKDGLYVPR